MWYWCAVRQDDSLAEVVLEPIMFHYQESAAFKQYINGVDTVRSKCIT